MQSSIFTKQHASPTKQHDGVDAVDARLPLSALLSQVLVAFTIELDNEFERQMPHWTTDHSSTDHGTTAGSRHGLWLVSLAMWANCMQFIGEEGVTVRELERVARTTTNLNGMQRWGYIVVAPDATDPRAKLPRRDWVIRATPAGRKARETWRPLFGEIENRWKTRYGKDEIDQLRESLLAVICQIDMELPDCLPILGYGLFGKGHYPGRDHAHERKTGGERRPVTGGADDGSGLALSVLLSRVLLAFTIEFERESKLSLAIIANVVRVLDENGVPVRELPLLTGISKEAIRMATGFLQSRGYAVVEAVSGPGRGKLVRLTPKGREAQDAYRPLADALEERWQTRFGTEAIRSLREQLERLAGEPTAQPSPLFRALEPHPGGWRAAIRKPNTLPHYPMVLHRGGYPDGS